MYPEEKLENTLRAWRRFVNHGELLPVISPAVIRSWIRSRKLGVSVERKELPRVSEEVVSDLKKRHRFELQAAEPVLEKIASFMDEGSIQTFLCSLKGVVLKKYGDLDSEIKINVGNVFQESEIGSNCVSLCSNNMALTTVFGPEHYNRNWHNKIGIAIPFYDNDRALGIIAAMMNLEAANLNYEAIIKMAAEWLETRYKMLYDNYEQKLLEEAFLTKVKELEIPGESPSFLQCLRIINDFAHDDGPILFVGETGSGRESLARYAHRESSCEGKFIVFRPEWGNYDEKKTALEACEKLAKGGTLYIKELEFMPAFLQERLLKIIKFNDTIRVMAGCKPHFKSKLEKIKFNRELYWRLSSRTVNVPSLKESPED